VTAPTIAQAPNHTQAARLRSSERAARPMSSPGLPCYRRFGARNTALERASSLRDDRRRRRCSPRTAVVLRAACRRV
jgi:hypothetical protein